VSQDSDQLSLFRHRVRDLVKRPVVTCGRDMAALEIARLFTREGIGSVVVTGADGAPVGIVTDRDLRHRIVADGRDPRATAASAVMSAPLITIRPDAFAFEAVLEMTRQRIRHLVVVDGGRARGVISSRDFLLLQGSHPVVLAREIARAVSLDALVDLAARVTGLVRRLLAEGGSAHDIGQIVAELNDRVVARVLALAAGALEEAGEEAPPVPYCWLSFGSEARREQTLRTDQDNGLLYADPPPHLREVAAQYYARFAGAVIEGLVRVGFPRCPGGAMASNPRWCQPASVWAEYFRRWMDNLTPEHVLAASIYFDLRPLAGALPLADPLLALIRVQAREHPPFLRFLAHEVASRRVPLTMFGNIAIERSGTRRGTVDLKSAGTLQLVGAARVHALQLGLAETNTVDRFDAAAVRGLIPAAQAGELGDAYKHLMRLRLAHQLEQLRQGRAPDNRISPRRLSRADSVLLLDALRTVTRLQAEFRERFMTALLG